MHIEKHKPCQLGSAARIVHVQPGVWRGALIFLSEKIMHSYLLWEKSARRESNPLYTRFNLRYRMPESMRSHSRPVTVIGGMNMDIHVTADAPTYKRGTSNPAGVRLAPGGVGRNIAENLARLGIAVRLLSVAGDDLISDRLVAETGEAGVDVAGVARIHGQSGIYVSLLDGGGELDTAVSDMAAMDGMDIDFVERCQSQIRDSAIVVADANVPAAALQRVVEIANEAGVPLILDPVSVAKAQRVAGLVGEIFVATPDAAEAEVLAGASSLVARHIVVTLGCDGARWTDRKTGMSVGIPPRDVTVVDVTGAGDAFVAGLVAALHHRHEMPEALRVAVETAAVVAGSHSCTLTPDESVEIRNRLRGE